MMIVSLDKREKRDAVPDAPRFGPVGIPLPRDGVTDTDCYWTLYIMQSGHLIGTVDANSEEDIHKYKKAAYQRGCIVFVQKYRYGVYDSYVQRPLEFWKMAHRDSKPNKYGMRFW